MDTNAYYALLAPVFLLAMAIEAWVARRRGLRVYRLEDTAANLCCGAGQVLCGILTGALLIALYEGFRERFAVVEWGTSPIPWILAFVGVDFCYYWWHRASHAVPLLWAFHAPHHQSREMNLSVAVRQPFLSDLTAIPFFALLPLLGVPAGAFFLAVGCLSLYEALLHTELFDGGRAFGRVMNTPAFHRLHHATNPIYRDHNFASTTVVWDRLFGTAVEEAEPPVYGTVPAFSSANPLWAQAAPLLALVARIPAKAPEGRVGRVWLVIQLTLLAVATAVLLGVGRALPVATAALAVGWVLAGMGALGGAMDGRRWAGPATAAWLAALPILALA